MCVFILSFLACLSIHGPVLMSMTHLGASIEDVSRVSSYGTAHHVLLRMECRGPLSAVCTELTRVWALSASGLPLLLEFSPARIPAGSPVYSPAFSPAVGPKLWIILVILQILLRGTPVPLFSDIFAVSRPLQGNLSLQVLISPGRETLLPLLSSRSARLLARTREVPGGN